MRFSIPWVPRQSYRSTYRQSLFIDGYPMNTVYTMMGRILTASIQALT